MKPYRLFAFLVAAIVVWALIKPIYVTSQQAEQTQFLQDYTKNLHEQFYRCYEKREITEKDPAEKRTYEIKDPFPPRASKAPPRRSFLDKLLGRNRLPKNPQLSNDFIQLVAKDTGWDLRAITAITERSEEIAKNRDVLIAENQNQSLQDFDDWLGKNPKASAKEVRKEFDRILLKTGLFYASRPKFDWRERGLDVGTVMDQKYCNSCWAFATVDAFRGSLLLQKMRTGFGSDSSVDNTESLVQELLNCIDEQDICKGDRFWKALEYMKTKGVPVPPVSLKYTGVKDDSTSCTAQQFLKALTWRFVNEKTTTATTDELKQALVKHGPIVAHISSEECFPFYSGGVYNEKFYKTIKNTDGSKSYLPLESGDQEPYINHTFLIIGWDDNHEGNGGAWLVKNSYGTGWGENGFAWIKYGIGGIGKYAAWVDADPGLKK
jgi:C1A family cysteine protease